MQCLSINGLVASVIFGFSKIFKGYCDLASRLEAFRDASIVAYTCFSDLQLCVKQPTFRECFGDWPKTLA